MVLELYCNIILKNRQKALKNTLSLIQFIKSLENHRNLELEVLKGSTYYTIQEYLLRRRWHPTPIFVPGKSHGWRSLVGCSPWGREGLHTTERLPFHFSLSCMGEGNGNPLQCSCLENPRDGGAWWAAVSGVAQSRTQLKRLSSRSSNIRLVIEK